MNYCIYYLEEAVAHLSPQISPQVSATVFNTNNIISSSSFASPATVSMLSGNIPRMSISSPPTISSVLPRMSVAPPVSSIPRMSVSSSPPLTPQTFGLTRFPSSEEAVSHLDTIGTSSTPLPSGLKRWPSSEEAVVHLSAPNTPLFASSRMPSFSLGGGENMAILNNIAPSIVERPLASVALQPYSPFVAPVTQSPMLKATALTRSRSKSDADDLPISPAYGPRASVNDITPATFALNRWPRSEESVWSANSNQSPAVIINPNNAQNSGHIAEKKEDTPTINPRSIFGSIQLTVPSAVAPSNSQDNKENQETPEIKLTLSVPKPRNNTRGI